MLGIIGGSGLYNLDGLMNQRWIHVPSPFGNASDDLLFGELNGFPLVFLPRHGRGHKISPSEINFRANIDVLKRVGVTEIVSFGAVGSLREHLRPGIFVLVDQFVDRTFARPKSFFGTGLVAHVSMAHPVCQRLGKQIAFAASESEIEFNIGGTYLVMEGPQFSTKAESQIYRNWQCDVIGMTNMPEAKLAREAEICYAAVSMVTDFDCWHPGHDSVTAEQVVKIMSENIKKAKTLVQKSVSNIQKNLNESHCSCHRALDSAIMTSPDAISLEAVQNLDAVAGRIIKKLKQQ